MYEMTDEAPSADDRRLLGELRAVFEEVDPVPQAVLTAARESFTWRTIDTELATLNEDTLIALESGVRGDSRSRLLTFDAEHLTVVVEVTDIGARRRLLGQLVPAGPRSIEIRHAQETTVVDTDELGRFAADSVPSGPVSIACTGEDGRSVITSWVSI